HSKPAKQSWWNTAWNQDYAWFTKAEARQFLPAVPQAGRRRDVPVSIIHRIACAHLVDNVRGQTVPFEEDQVTKARLVVEVTGVDANVVTLRLEGETRTADGEGALSHGLEMRLLGTVGPFSRAGPGRSNGWCAGPVATRSSPLSLPPFYCSSSAWRRSR